MMSVVVGLCNSQWEACCRFTCCHCWCLQDLPLFNDTIYYNILYGRLGASQEDIFQAAKQAAVHDQILAMPDG